MPSIEPSSNLILKILANTQDLNDDYFPSVESEWDYIFRRARTHALVPNLWSYLKNRPGDLPLKAAQTFRKEYHRYVASLEIKKKYYQPILEILSKNLSSVVILKGIYLAEKFYPQEILRSFSDLDLLIPENEQPKAEKLLKNQGYKGIEQWDRFFWEKPYEIKIFQREKEPLLEIEIHNHLINKSRYRRALNLDMEEVWSQVKPTTVLGQKVYELALNHLLLYLIFHQSITHRFDRIIWLYDLHQIITKRRESINWEEFKELTFTVKARTFVYLALSMTKRLFNTEIPQDFLKEIKPNYFSFRIFQQQMKNVDLVNLPKYTFSDLLFFILRDDFRYRLSATLGLPYRIMRFYLKGNAW